MGDLVSRCCTDRKDEPSRSNRPHRQSQFSVHSSSSSDEGDESSKKIKDVDADVDAAVENGDAAGDLDRVGTDGFREVETVADDKSATDPEKPADSDEKTSEAAG
eukprot:gnl/TRDRNA2_/TRDRNA2_90724_c0_seq1.p1 gnl/TRDRNA2_/TRDRNA2_90724_c0~~gnl/TRDRNA2_/TRDRNA2_90724_c0_seq1.p1  ORF type:complete len:105 (-),score=21.70 gnl/TRDRNA2_/TRDRNA2_90724_c0_seq1:81-395(-)